LTSLEVNLALGQIHTLQGERQEAHQCYQQIFAHLETLSHSDETQAFAARACRGMGELLEQEAPQEALTWLQRGLSLVPEVFLQEKAALHIALGTVQMYLANYVDAQAALMRGLELLPSKPSQLEAIALLNLDSVFFHRGDLEGARVFALRALEISQYLHDQFRIAETLGNLAIIKFVSGDWQGGVKDFQQAADLAERLGYEKFRAAVEMNLGTAHLNMGDATRAQDHLTKSLAWARKTHDRLTETGALCSLADLHIRHGAHALARPLLQEAEIVAQEVEDRGFLSAIYTAYAELELAGNDTRLARCYAEKALKLAQELGEDLEQGIALRTLGDVLLAEDESARACAAFDQSHTLLNGKDPYEAARTKVRWGRMLLSGGQADQGQTLLEEAHTIFQTLGASTDLMSIQQGKESRRRFAQPGAIPKEAKKNDTQIQ
jgi:tetratricopeptide (TPR) repeat protein